ncbi:MAG: aminoacyl-tRNA hydrolase [bacterium]|nr:aminoacyl-tRNA hydrolase [bacterium]
MPALPKKIMVVGLGNPGKKYEFTRHNLGFRVLDRLREQIGMPTWQLQKALAAEVSEARIGGVQVVLLKPLTYMNLSGKSVKAALKQYGMRVSNLHVVHDDKDVMLANLKVKSGSSAAGHKGVASLIEELGSKNFNRYRMGIMAPSAEGVETEKYVVSKFLPDEEPAIRNAIDQTTDTIIADLGLGR